jgi:hypothetical protein
VFSVEIVLAMFLESSKDKTRKARPLKALRLQGKWRC